MKEAERPEEVDMSCERMMDAGQALEKLKEGNRKYLNAEVNNADISPLIRLQTYENGQSPYAIIVACSDSRVIPEAIFSAGIGELFVVRVAGNVIGDHQLGSIEYAAEHLGCCLVVVLGHTRCGAVGAAMAGDPGGYIRLITEEIQKAIGDEKDDLKAGCLNVERNVKLIRESLHLSNDAGLQVIGAMYHTDSGRAEFLEG